MVALAALAAVCVTSLQPLRPIGAGAFVVLVGALGLGLLPPSVRQAPAPARWGLALGTGVLCLGVIGLVLADRGWFGPLPLIAAVLALTALGAGLQRRRPHGASRMNGTQLIALALLGAFTATIPAYSFDAGGRDAGYYVLTSQYVRATGQITAKLDPDVAEAMRRFSPRVGSGGTPVVSLPLVRGSTDTTVPHGYHLTPVAMAVGGTVTGGSGQWIVTLCGVIVVLLVAGVAALLARPRDRTATAWAAGALLACNAALIYFSRYPMTEVPAAVALWTAVVALSLAGYHGGRRWPLLAGAALGAATLTRPDTWPLLAVAPVAAVLLHRQQDGRVARWFAAALAPVVTYATVRALTTTDTYTSAIIDHALPGAPTRKLLVAIVTAAIAGSLLASFWRGPRLRGLWGLAIKPNALDAIAALVLVLGLLLMLSPPTEGLAIYKTYVTVPGVLLAALGLGILASRRTRGDWERLRPFGAAAILALLALALVSGKPQVLVADQYWTARRFLPAAIPMAAVLAGLAVGAAVAWLHRRTTTARVAAMSVICGAVAAFGISLRNALPAITITEFQGLPEQIDRIDAAIAERDPLVLLGPHVEARGVIGPALALGKRRAALTLNLDRAYGESDADNVQIDDPEVASWLQQVATRRPIYLVTTRFPPAAVKVIGAALTPVPVYATELVVRWVETPVGRPPRGVGGQQYSVNVVRLAPAPRR